MPKFFIEHPVLANVIAIITMLLGAVALWRLPIEQYPDITPPTVRVTTSYPGANAEVLQNTVASPIEQEVNGVEGMLYMSSTCSSDGSYSLTVTFEIGTDLDEAQVLVQNRVAVAEPKLPEEVRRQGLTVKKQSSNILLVLSLTSPTNEYNTLFLANFATLRLRDELSRVRGVGEVTVFGTGNYSMRVWLDPHKLKARGMNAGDVVAALREQNVQVAAGQVGQPPVPTDKQFQYTVTTLGRLNDARQFENVVVKTGEDGRVVYLKDVAEVQLGAQSYDQFTEKKGAQNANIGIFQLPGANTLQVAKDVVAAMERLKAGFPPGVQYDVPLNTTKFVETSINEVYTTLIEAGVLVLIVIMLFLQDWRAVLIPATTVPVTIVGAFAAMYALGFTINMLTLFGLVLAIGIVVDDAIVVVEAAAHHIERGMPPKEATIRAMSEVLGPIIGITLVLMAVFIPSAMLGGVTGQLYRQFALTIAATALISAVNAVTLKPAQSALWLRPPAERKNWFFRGFEAFYKFFENVYVAIIRRLVRFTAPMMALFIGVAVATGVWYTRLPTGFFPTEDQGYMFAAIQLPDAASQERTHMVMRKIDKILEETPGVADWVSIGGLSLLDNSSAANAGTMFITFKDWSERHDPWSPHSLWNSALASVGLAEKEHHPDETLNGILGTLMMKFSQIEEAVVFGFPPPAIRGMGVRAGFELQVEDRGNVGLVELQQAAQAIVDAANQQAAIGGSARSTFRPGVPQLYIDVDRVKVKALNIPLTTVFETLQASLGSTYVNDFNKFGRTYQVRVQAAQDFRADPEDVARLEVTTPDGRTVPMGTLARIRRSFGPQIINRFNLYPTAVISGSPAVGYSSGDALNLLEEIAQGNLPAAMGYEWSGMAFQERRVGGEAIVVFALAVLLVYLVLAGQYESWILPLAVILVVPLGLLGSVAGVALRGQEINIFTQIGIVLIVALASKNAILIVEFARDKRKEGKSIVDAAVEASQLRFRPIIMTSFAFILGVLPLVFAHGAGAGGQQALGTAVFGGMLASTILAVFFVPVFFVVFQNLAEWLSERERPIAEGGADTRKAEPSPSEAAHGGTKGDGSRTANGHGPNGGNGHGANGGNGANKPKETSPAHAHGG